MTIRKLLSVSMVLCMIASLLVACSPITNPVTLATSDGNTVATSPSIAQTTTQKDVTLVCAFNMSDKERFIKFFDTLKAKYPYINYELLGLEASFNNYYTTCMASNSMPDIFSVNADAFGRSMAESGWMLNLKGSKVESALSESMVEAFTTNNGVFYGFPYGVATTVLFYNKEIFTRESIMPPTNWEEFLDVCSKLKTKGITPFAMMMGDISIVNNNFTSGFANNIVTTNPNWLKEVENGSFDFTQQGIVEIFDRTKVLIDNGYVQDGYKSSTFQSALDVFSMGDAAMVLAGAWFTGNIGKNADFEFSAVIPPWNKKGEPQAVAISPETGWGGNRKSGKDDAILKALEFLANDGYTIMQNAARSIPSVKDTTGCIIDESINNIISDILASKYVGKMQYTFLPFAMRVEIPKVFQDFASGNLNSSEAAAAIQTNYKSAIDAQVKK